MIRLLQTVTVAALAFWLLLTAMELEMPNPGGAVHPLAVIAVLLAAIVFIVGVATERLGFWGVIAAFGIGAILLLIGSMGLLPTTDNPCPGDEVIIMINGKCYGMDTDENRRWVEGVLRGE